MAQWYEAAYFTMAEVGVQVQIPAGQLFVRFRFDKWLEILAEEDLTAKRTAT